MATVAFSGQPALWNVGNLAKPARITTLPSGDDSKLWGEAFSLDGRILAAYTDRLYLWNVTNPARPRLLRTLAAPVAPPGGPYSNASNLRGLRSVTGCGVAGVAARDATKLPRRSGSSGPGHIAFPFR